MEHLSITVGLLVFAFFVGNGAGEMICPPQDSNADSMMNERARLHLSLFCNYDKRVPPTGGTTVKLALSLHRAVVHENSLVMDTMAFVEWLNPYLSWNPGEFGGLQDMYVSGDDIWNPAIATMATVPWARDRARGDHGDLNEELWPGACVLHFNGTVRCTTSMQMGGECNVQAKYWPHATAACEIYIGLDYRVESGVHVVHRYNDTDGYPELEMYNGDVEWGITSLKRRNLEMAEITSVTYLLQLHRRGLLLASVAVAPILVLSIVILTSFCLPVGSQLRLGLGCCAIFGISLNSTLVFDTLPDVAGPTPVVVIVYRNLLLLAGLSVVESLLLSLLLPSERKTPVPPRWLYTCRDWLLNSTLGSTILTTLWIFPSNSEAGASDGADEAVQADTADADPDSCDDVPMVIITDAGTGPHKIWIFFVSVLDRGMFGVYIAVCSGLCAYLMYAMRPFDKSHEMKGRWLWDEYYD